MKTLFGTQFSPAMLEKTAEREADRDEFLEMLNPSDENIYNDIIIVNGKRYGLTLLED